MPATVAAAVERADVLPKHALGIGLRPAHYRALAEQRPALDYLEIITENFLGDGGAPRRRLEAAHAWCPIVLHGVSLNLLGAEPLDDAYLDEVARLADLVDAPFVTDHLCWSAAGGQSHHDLLPAPHTEDLVDFAAERAARVQRRLGRPFGLENLSSYVKFAESTMSEQEFYTRVVGDAGCWFMLDVNNVYVSSVNHGFDPRGYLDAIDYRRVLQVHLAGHERRPDGLIVDTHDRAVADEVWALYRHAWQRGGPFPTLIEWDAAIPALPEVVAELARAAEVRR